MVHSVGERSMELRVRYGYRLEPVFDLCSGLLSVFFLLLLHWLIIF